MDQNSEVNRLMESLNMLIDRGDEPEIPASSQVQRLEASLQIIDGKLSDHGRMHSEALSSIKQLTDVLVCQGQLLAKMHQRQETAARDLDLVTTEVKQARADTMSQLQMIARTQVATVSQLQAIRPVAQGAMPTNPSDFLGGSGYPATQRSVHSPVSAQLSPTSTQPNEYLSINQVALHTSAYGGPVTPQSADFSAADARRAHSAVATLAQQQQLTPLQQQMLYHQLQKQQQQQQQRLRLQHQQQMALQPYAPTTQQQQHHQYQYLQQQQHFVQAASVQQQQQAQYAIAPAHAMSNSLVSVTPDLSPNTSAPVKIEPGETVSAPIQEPTDTRSSSQEHVSHPALIAEQPPKHAPVATTKIEEISQTVATMAAAPSVPVVSNSPAIVSTTSVTPHVAPTIAPTVAVQTAPAAKVPTAAKAAPTPTKAAVTPAPTTASKPVASVSKPAVTPPKPVTATPSNAFKPSMLPVSLIKPLSPAAAQAVVKATVKLGLDPKSVGTNKPSVATPASAVVHAQPRRPPMEDAATAAARAAIPQVLTAKPQVTSAHKKSEPSKSSTVATTAKRVTTAPVTGSIASNKALDTGRKQGKQSSMSPQSSLSSMSISESESIAPVRSNEREVTKYKNNLLDGELEKSDPSRLSNSSGTTHPSRTHQVEASSRAYSTRERSDSRSRRYRSPSRRSSRSRRHRSRSRSNSRPRQAREASRSLSRSLSAGRRVRPSSSRSRNGWADTTNSVELTIKGQTKSRRDEESAVERPPKYRAISPRVNSVVMFSSDNDGSGSGSDVDDLIEQRIVRSSSPELGTGDKVAVIGIVGASSSKQSALPNTDISSRLGARIPVYDNDDNPYAHRLGEAGFSMMPSSHYLGGNNDYARQPYGAHQSNSDSWYPSSNVLRDSSGEEISPARMSTLLRPFCFMVLNLVPTVYRQLFGCQPIPSGVKVPEFNRMLTGMDGFKFWTLQLPGPTPSRPIFMNFLLRDGDELGSMRQNLLRRLALTEGSRAVVLGPLLCYFLITLACMRVDQMTGHILDKMFIRITGKSLGSLRVVTENGIRKMSADELCEMAKTWVRDLCLFIANGSRMQESLDLATGCYEAYVKKFRATGSSSTHIDLDGKIAKEMLENNEDHCRMFLGIRAAELTKLYVYLVDPDVLVVTIAIKLVQHGELEPNRARGTQQP
ncbi:hypothetical protein H4S07_001969 [Coemansia furcata]|uniref:Uncharacterized protein n=1 Tax=Coemansia furcata TaxID=417177 RepID=A0ACC1LMS6_9FUNG|nr:hypothetical protein H4S07_001969 [Coemansia furcata]